MGREVSRRLLWLPRSRKFGACSGNDVVRGVGMSVDAPTTLRRFRDQHPGAVGQRRITGGGATMSVNSLTTPSCLVRSST